MTLSNEQKEFFASLSNVTTVTYSAEDNKLRIRCDEWLDKEDYLVLREFGFVYAPKQDITGVATWTPSRLAFCMLISGNDITPEESTVIERAQAKASRLESLADKRKLETGLFVEAAQRISSMIPMGQPILIGHHSEKKALRDQNKVESNLIKAEQSANAVNYWNYRAMAVERHANRRADFGVRSRRIEVLLADLRKKQRYINESQKTLLVWTDLISKIEDKEIQAKKAIYFAAFTGHAPSNAYKQAENKEITISELIEKGIDYCKAQIASPSNLSWISHILNRLMFERHELGLVHSYDQKLTAVIIQKFLRVQGADKPSAKKDKETGKWICDSIVPFPLHISEEKHLELEESEIIKMMVDCGYEVPTVAAKKATTPTLNFKADSVLLMGHGTDKKVYRQIELTKAQWKEIYSEGKFPRLSSCGKFKMKTCVDIYSTEPYYSRERVCVFITDSKAHPVPESESVITNAQIEHKAA